MFGALPYLLSGEQQLSSPVDALFESMSGFTTTGSSVLTDIPALNNSMLMWRQFTQWLGGMGIIVLALTILARLRVGGRQALFHTEAPGPAELATFPATIRDTARRFLGLYVGLTLAEIAVLSFLAFTDIDPSMSFFDAVAHAFTTIPTGGFSPEGRSIEAFGAATQWAIVPFMILGGTSFALLYWALVRRRPGSFLRDDEFRVYLLVLTAASLVIVVELVSEQIVTGEAAVRQGVFNTVSVFTTTGCTQSHPRFLRQSVGGRQGDHTYLLSIGTNQAHFRRVNLLIDARCFFLNYSNSPNLLINQTSPALMDISALSRSINACKDIWPRLEPARVRTATICAATSLSPTIIW